MTAMLIEINDRQRKSTFYCPLTGIRVWEDGEETFETCTKPYFVFLMTAEGRLFSRVEDGLPIGHRRALNLVIDELQSARPSADEMQTFMPSVIAGLLPDSVLLFELRSPQARRHDEPATWIAMDFGLPQAEVGPENIDNTVTLPEPGLMSDWFEDLTGFSEQSPDQVRAKLELQDNILTSKVNGRSWHAGKLETPTLGELRRRVARLAIPARRLRVQEIAADVRDLHADPKNAGAAFQVASQFNLLEMADPDITPEQGVGLYQHDPTQGPACATSAGAGTIQRNYFTEVGGLPGQAHDRQIDCLADLGRLLGNEDGRLWKMRNGYALASEDGLDIIGNRLLKADEAEIDALRAALRIGIQWHAQVTLTGCIHRVTQVFCSALPVAYGGHDTGLWEPFARLILEAAYEATLCVSLLNREATGNPESFLTLLGGGAFGNSVEWITESRQCALDCHRQAPLQVTLVTRP